MDRYNAETFKKIVSFHVKDRQGVSAWAHILLVTLFLTRVYSQSCIETLHESRKRNSSVLFVRYPCLSLVIKVCFPKRSQIAMVDFQNNVV